MGELITIRLKPEFAHDDKRIEQAVRGTGKWNEKSGQKFRIRKRSIDARRKIVYVLQIEIGTESEINQGLKPRIYSSDSHRKAAIVGAGPAGLFAALKLLENGIKPIIFERGKIIKERRRDLANLMKKHIVNPESNYCFGEGGAGTFSDGKLYTRSSKRGSVTDILEILVQHGADPSILIDAHPHIGTNKLPKIIGKIRETITNAGGEIRFNSKVTDLKLDPSPASTASTELGDRSGSSSVASSKISGLQINGGDWEDFDQVILATGHSSRDIYQLLYRKGILLEEKGFAVGVRVEHDQKLIDQIQYHRPERGEYLPPAAYSLVSQIDDCGVYSFCMCPGGVIAPCATETEEVVTNGWSPSKRNNPHANSGIVVSVVDEDLLPFADKGVLAGMYFQKYLERKAWTLAGKTQKAPAQRLVDFIANKKSTSLPDSSYVPGLSSVNFSEIFPERFCHILKEGFKSFAKKMPGFMHEDAIIVGVETRSSSPLRIPRNKETFQHPEISGLYPCGEGAGFAGGIVSAAIDGENCAGRVVKMYQDHL